MKLHFKSTYANRESGLWIRPSHFSTSCFFWLTEIPWKLPHWAYSGRWKPWFPIIFTMKSVHSHLPGAPSTGANLRAEALLWGSLGRWRLEWHKRLGYLYCGWCQTWLIHANSGFDRFRFVGFCRYSVHFFPLNLLTLRYEILTCFKSCHLLASGWRFTKPLGFTRLCRSLAGAIPFWSMGCTKLLLLTGECIWGEHDIEHKAGSWSL